MTPVECFFFISSKLIDGSEIAARQRSFIQESVADFNSQSRNPLALAVILVGNNSASHIYVENKRKACEDVGIRSVCYHLDETTTFEALRSCIFKLNTAPDIHGILLQLPLPPLLNAQKAIELINPLKDVDGLHPYNLGRLMIGAPTIAPCTPTGCVQLIKSVVPSLQGKRVTIVGRSVLVGKPLVFLLEQENATVTLAHSKTNNLRNVCQQAEILVSAVGMPGFIDASYVAERAVVIDVGINRVTDNIITGDVLFDSVYEKCAHITPVPKGVGPMTIANLLSNTLKAAQLQINHQSG